MPIAKKDEKETTTPNGKIKAKRQIHPILLLKDKKETRVDVTELGLHS